MFYFIKENLYWFILAIIATLILLFAPRIDASPLDAFLTEHNLEFPHIVKDQMKKQNLVAGAGVMNEKEQIFTVYFIIRPDESITTIDIKKSVMQVAFYLTKKKIVVEYPAVREIQNRHAKCWNEQITYERVLIYYELFPL